MLLEYTNKIDKINPLDEFDLGNLDINDNKEDSSKKLILY